MKLISNLKQSPTFKKVLYVAIISLLTIYVFCVASFEKASLILRLSIYGSMVLLGFCSFTYCLLYRDFRFNKTALIVPLFVLHALIGTIIFSHKFNEWFSLVLLAGSFFIFLFSFKSLQKKEIILTAISVALFLFTLYFIFFFRKQILSFSFLKGDGERLGQPINNPNDISAFAVVGFAVPLYLLLFWNKRLRFAFIIPVLTSLLVGVSTGSRTFILIVILFVLVLLFFKFKKHKLIYLIILSSVVVTSIVLINLPFMSMLRDRLIVAFQTLFGIAQKVDTSVLERTVMIDYGFYLGSKRIFFGYGADGFAIVSGIGTYAHSNFAETLCNFGFIGLTLFYLPLILLVIKAFTNKDIDKTFILTFFIYYLIVSFSNVFYYKKIYYLILSLMFYLAFIEHAKAQTMPLVSTIKKVLFTCDSMTSGGAEKVIASLSNEMHKQGIEVVIYGVADLKSPNSFYNLDGVNYINNADGSGKRINPLKRIMLIRKQIVSLKPDIVISFLPNANIYTWLSLVGTGIPYIVSERNNPSLDPKNKLERILKLISFQRSYGVVFQTEEAMNYYPNSVKNKSTIIKNPISIFDYSDKKISVRNKVVLAVGRLNKQKNYKCLLKAFSIFNQQKRNKYTLKIYGDGPLKNELMEYSRELGVINYVQFMGNDTEWHSKEQNDAMYVLSSDYEGMPNALAEAMALGIPSISTDCPSGGSRELIKDGENGYLVPVNNPDALASKMIELSNQPAETFVDKNINMINEYSVESVTLKWIAFIKGLTKEIYE